MPGVEEVSGEQAAAATQLDDQPIALAHGLDQLEDPRPAGIRVEAEPEVVHQCEVPPIVGRVGNVHRPMLAAHCPGVDRGPSGRIHV